VAARAPVAEHGGAVADGQRVTFQWIGSRPQLGTRGRSILCGRRVRADAAKRERQENREPLSRPAHERLSSSPQATNVTVAIYPETGRVKVYARVSKSLWGLGRARTKSAAIDTIAALKEACRSVCSGADSQLTSYYGQ
jgi:hypothetical protein